MGNVRYFDANEDSSGVMVVNVVELGRQFEDWGTPALSTGSGA